MSPEASYRRYTANKAKFKYYLALLGAFVLFWLFLAIQGVRDELLSKSPDVQTVTAHADRDAHDCDKSGCYYGAYGHYAINGMQEDNVKLGKWNYPVQGEVGVRINPSQPRFVMDLYRTSYLPQIIIPAAVALAFTVWGCVLFWLFKRRGKRAEQAFAHKPA